MTTLLAKFAEMKFVMLRPSMTRSSKLAAPKDSTQHACNSCSLQDAYNLDNLSMQVPCVTDALVCMIGSNMMLRACRCTAMKTASC